MLANNVYISQSGQNVVFGTVEATTITADELQITETTRSVLYESGSTKFGDTLDDTHQFTGSVFITGSTTTQQLFVVSPTVPSTPTSTGTRGEIAWDENYLFVATNDNEWKRVPISSW
jgi:hypothetical protein